MTTLREAAQQALEALDNCTSEHGHRCNRCDSEVDEGGRVVTALRSALAQQEPRNQCGETCERAKLCAVCARGLEQEPLSVEDLARALVASRVIDAAAIDDPEGYDDGVMLDQVRGLHRRLAALAQQEPEGGWQSAPSPQVTQRIADMPMSEYRRGVNDGFKLGLREGRIKAEDEMREQPEQEPVAWQVHPFDYGIGFEGVYAMTQLTQQRDSWIRKGWKVTPLYTHPPRREWVSLTEEEIGDVFQVARNAKLGSANDNSRHRLSVVEIARAIEAALKERNT